MCISVIPLSPENSTILLVMPAMVAFGIVGIVCTPANMHQPHKLIDDDDEEEMILTLPALSPSGSVLLDCFAAFSSEEYQPILLVTMAGSLAGSIPGLVPGVILFLDEDHTAIGADADTFKANVTAAFYLASMLVAVPLGRWLDRLQRPMGAFATGMWLSAVMLAVTLLAKERSPYWSIGGIIGLNFVYVTQSFLLTPSFLEGVTSCPTIGRDINFMFAIIAVVQTLVPLGLSPIYEWFGSTTISGRERPVYAFEAYVVILSGFALIAFTSGVLLLAARCQLQTVMTNRLQRLVFKTNESSTYSGVLPLFKRMANNIAPVRKILTKREVTEELRARLDVVSSRYEIDRAQTYGGWSTQ